MTAHALRIAGLGVAVSAVGAAGACMLVSPMIGHVPSWFLPIGVVLLLGVATLGASIVQRAYHQHRLAGRLLALAKPVTVADISVQALAGMDAALVAGLRHPQIFCSSELASILGPDELRAVMLHEQYHQLDRAPARLVVLEAMAPVLNLFDAGAAWLTRRMASLEIAADDHARRQGSTPKALASALLKLAPHQQGNPGISFTSVTELRLRALLDEQPAPAAPLALVWLLAPLATAVICLLFVVPR